MISIIIPTYNRVDFIEETITSIKNQTFKEWECIIVDDGSTDNTYEFTKQHTEGDKRFKVFKRPKVFKKGPSACRNYGLTKSSGDYFQFFDSDDIMHPEHLKLKIEAIGSNDLVVCKIKEFSIAFKKANFSKSSKNLMTPLNLFEDFVTGAFPMMMVAPLWKASSLRPFLPIREDLHILEDHELYARALFDTKKVAIINKSLIYYRVGVPSSTNRFYSNVDYGLQSYLEAKRTVLNLSKKRKIKLAILKMTLGFFRQALAERNFKAAEKCLAFIKEEQLCYNFKLKGACFRICLFYIVFRIIKRGDTKFKPLFKL